MADDNTARGLPITTPVTREDVEGMIDQMQARIIASLTDYLSKMAPSVTAASAKPVDTGKSVKLQIDPEDYYEPEAFREDQEGLPYPVNSSVPAHSASRAVFSTMVPPKQVSEPMFTEEQIRKMVQGEVQASRMGLKGYFGLDLDSFSIVPGLIFPENFKAPKFTLYDGNSNAQEHLMMYCKKMAPYAANDDLMIYTFQDSLTGPGLKWFSGLDRSCVQSWRSLAEAFARHYAFNERLAVTKEDLGKMSKKPQESIREFAKRWMLAADQVKPPLEEKELANEFLGTLKAEYHERLASHINYDIFEMVEAIERMEKGPQVSRASEGPRDMKNNFKKKEDSVNVLSAPTSSAPRPSFVPRAPLATPVHHPMPPYPNYQNSAPYQQNYYPPQAPPLYRPQAFTHPRAEFRQVRPHDAYNPGMQQARPRAPVVTFDPIPISYGELYDQLFARGRITPAAENLNHTPASRNYNPRANCIFHSGQQGHDIENCFHFKTRVQEMIRAGQLNFADEPNINANPLPNHNAPTVGAIFSEYKEDDLVVADVTNYAEPITMHWGLLRE